jgi:hypothetical protein
MSRATSISVTAYTNRFVGTTEKGMALLRLLEAIDGHRWLPDKWNTAEPIRYPLTLDARPRILEAWSSPRPSGSRRVVCELLFRKTRPRLLVRAEAWRSRRPWPNELSGDFDAAVFRGQDAAGRVREMLLTFVRWSEAIYGTAFHSAQTHARGGPGTPLDGLRRLNWLTYWGQPYVELIGLDRLLAAPCHRVETVGSGVLMQATPRFDSASLVGSTTLLEELERYLGADLFAGPDYPDVRCRVPSFDMSETICEIAPPAAMSPRGRPVVRANPEELRTVVAALSSEAETIAGARGLTLDYSPASVKAVDSLLDECRKDFPSSRAAATNAKRKLASAFGAYVGEVVRRARGGEWQYDSTIDDPASLALQSGAVTIFPIDRTYRRVTRGPSESLVLFVSAVLGYAGGEPGQDH